MGSQSVASHHHESAEVSSNEFVFVFFIKLEMVASTFRVVLGFLAVASCLSFSVFQPKIIGHRYRSEKPCFRVPSPGALQHSFRFVRMDAGEPTKENKTTLKKLLGVIGAGFVSIAFPASTLAAPQRGSIYESEPMVLPSQQAHARNNEDLLATLAKDQRVWAGVGACAAAAGAFKLHQVNEKKKTEKFRAALPSITGLKIDPNKRIVKKEPIRYDDVYNPDPAKAKKPKAIKQKYNWEEEWEEQNRLAKLAKKMAAKPEPVKPGAPMEDKVSPPPSAASSVKVEVVDSWEGPKTGKQKTLAEEMQGMSLEEMMAKVASDPAAAADPSVFAAAMPEMKRQMEELAREGVPVEEVRELKAQLRAAGMDIDAMLRQAEEAQRNGAMGPMGAEGLELMQAMRKLLNEDK